MVLGHIIIGTGIALFKHLNFLLIYFKEGIGVTYALFMSVSLTANT